MCKCILCNNKFDELTEEHIIPYALGNDTLKANILCKDCNSDLGSFVDCSLIDNIAIQIKRMDLKISGRGKVPNPFKQGVDAKGNKYIVNNDFKPTIINSITKDGNRFRAHASNKEELKKIVRKSLTRDGYYSEKINNVMDMIDKIEANKFKPELIYDIEINLNDYCLAILKIAYEYAYLRLGDSYLNDTRANEIKDIIRAKIDNKITANHYKNMFVNQINEEFSGIIAANNLKDICHFIMLMPTANNCIGCLISLFGDINLSYIVLVSRDQNKYTIPDPDLILIKSE
ncbi:MAG: hypothetical protein IJP63_08015 [Acholeplasmatales bacterium]|nr:hypothetical protein [Acholeplasmatales bacterium]